MAIVDQARREPITFENASTHDEGGLEVLDDDSGRELAKQIAARNADLIQALHDR